LVDLQNKDEKSNKKSFQVSPFMNLDMSYFWQVKPPSDDKERLVINIESKRGNLQNNKKDKLFDASLVLYKKDFTHKGLLRIGCQLPLMTIKVVFSIYWQALKLFVKGIPFIGYQKSS
jgi:DUF1365 family protein